MATYIYRCPKCAGDIEVRVPVGEHTPSITCPSCGGNAPQHFTPPSVDTFTPRTLYDMAPEGPVHVESRDDLHRAELQYGVVLDGLRRKKGKRVAVAVGSTTNE